MIFAASGVTLMLPEAIHFQVESAQTFRSHLPATASEPNAPQQCGIQASHNAIWVVSATSKLLLRRPLLMARDIFKGFDSTHRLCVASFIYLEAVIFFWRAIASANRHTSVGSAVNAREEDVLDELIFRGHRPPPETQLEENHGRTLVQLVRSWLPTRLPSSHPPSLLLAPCGSARLFQ
ncbi:uncharacterized protein [Panulirus ornatus]|uniref:uncharacterized protein isoform X1 n=1 Tax=Panulirus ornatus TaxID=150431 RepID=UPI003A83D2FF